jgi:Na+:H+ antiporter, NhaA family
MIATKSTASQFGESIRKFVKLESIAGLILVAAAAAAMLLKNSAYGSNYEQLLLLDGAVRVGNLLIHKPLFLWVNDLWMTVFFFLVGMEIKREAVEGYLSDRRQLVLPLVAALGGIVVPAAIYMAIAGGDPVARQGWAIPTATDIAFALGVLALLGSRVPVGLKIFLMTLAIIDDFAAIAIIALFYAGELSAVSLSLAAVAIVVLFLMNRFGSTGVIGYLLVGAVLWVCVLKSGVHATLAGVVLAMAIPARSGAGETSLLSQMIHALHPWVAFGVLPAFAFVNAGIDFSQMDASKILNPVPVGIFLGLLVGKQLGVFAFAWIAIKLRFAQLPAGATWPQLYGVSILCGIGFTMSLFIGSLALSEGGAGYARVDRLAIITASVLSGFIGYLVLWWVSPRRQPATAP